jgi:hypothetical protein
MFTSEVLSQFCDLVKQSPYAIGLELTLNGSLIIAQTKADSLKKSEKARGSESPNVQLDDEAGEAYDRDRSDRELATARVDLSIAEDLAAIVDNEFYNILSRLSVYV